LVPGQLPSIESFSDLGDIFLGMPYVYSQCCKEGSDIQKVLPVLVTHGLCHLLGYDHLTHQQWKQMFQKESEILMKFNEIMDSRLQPLTTAFDSQEC
ncbi:endoribonuclease YbeY-like, partial [Anneissia japonica]|uniref:endoribonuclease YbeY-like n=1 Tax=Anneissia japonica TaxID=1529436 RepID=UPI0014257F17